jgi:hypothetical protein
VDPESYTTVSTIGGFSDRVSDAGPCTSDSDRKIKIIWPFNQQRLALVGRTGHSAADDIVLVD